MKIDHIGYAVKDVDKAKIAMEALGFLFEPTIVDEGRNVSLAFGKLDGYRVELVAPLSEDSPVSSLLSKLGPTPYHLCYASDNLEAEVADLANKRFKVAIPPTPAVAFGGKKVVFMYSLAMGLFEIVQR